MSDILFIALLIVCGFNLIQIFNVVSPSTEYHIINRIKYINESGTSLKEKTIQYEIPYKPNEEWLDIQQIISNWNKSRPIVD